MGNENNVVELTSDYTSNFPKILEYFGISLLVSTYQAGKLIILRNDNDSLNTHYINHNKPMGLYVDSSRLIVGDGHEVIEYFNTPNMTQKLQNSEQYDSCYMVKNRYVTGDIDIHEINYVDEKIYAVNTKFSHICTIDNQNSFTPYWVPPFISNIAHEDKCHLNGMCFKDNKPAYATALGESDSKESWRKNKLNGGIIIDIKQNKIIARGLSMPHSPTWYKDQLWVLESGYGRLSKVNIDTGTTEPMIELNGFTRGLVFYENFAFVALSKVRDSALFIGLPITEKHEDIQSGVSVVDLNTKEEIAFLRFTQGVDEIFDIKVAPYKFPEILERDDELHKIAYTIPNNLFESLTKDNR